MTDHPLQHEFRRKAKEAIEAGNVMFPMACRCGRSIWIERKAFNDVLVFDTEIRKLGWGSATSFMPSTAYAVFEIICPKCVRDMRNSTN